MNGSVEILDLLLAKLKTNNNLTTVNGIDDVRWQVLLTFTF